MLGKLKRYQKDYDYSYCPGVYPTLELIAQRPAEVIGIILHSKGADNAGITKIRRLADQGQIEIIENERLVEKLTNRGNTYAIGVFKKYQSNLELGKNHLVLVNPSSMGNMGTMMRTLLAFGFTNLALVEPAADHFHPRVIRASMGAFFHLNIRRFRSFPDYWGSQSDRTLYPFMTDGKIDLPEIEFKAPYSLIFGGEGAGLDQDFHQYGQSIRIPQNETVDSLNLAQSVGIALYHSWVSRQNQ
jgi:TrmH family RNA methyltransferase